MWGAQLPRHPQLMHCLLSALLHCATSLNKDDISAAMVLACQCFVCIIMTEFLNCYSLI